MRIPTNIKRKTILPFLFVFCANALLAQNWQGNFEDALQRAKDEDKTLILVFAGSDWCAPCIKLEKEIWESEEFKAYANEKYVLYKADFPRKKSNKLSKEMAEKNKHLAEKYNTKGFFPLVVLMNGEGKVLGETAYKKMTPGDYINHLNSFITK